MDGQVNETWANRQLYNNNLQVEAMRKRKKRETNMQTPFEEGDEEAHRSSSEVSESGSDGGVVSRLSTGKLKQSEAR